MPPQCSGLRPAASSPAPARAVSKPAPAVPLAAAAAASAPFAVGTSPTPTSPVTFYFVAAAAPIIISAAPAAVSLFCISAAPPAVAASAPTALAVTTVLPSSAGRCFFPGGCGVVGRDPAQSFIRYYTADGGSISPLGGVEALADPADARTPGRGIIHMGVCRKQDSEARSSSYISSCASKGVNRGHRFLFSLFTLRLEALPRAGARAKAPSSRHGGPGRRAGRRGPPTRAPGP